MLFNFVSSYREGLHRCFDELSVERLECMAETLLRALWEGRQIFIVGNGGSASTASHMAVDLGKGTAREGRTRFKVISLTDNISLITAWANDASYDTVFVEQLKNLLEPQDVVIGISASGNSPNILRAIEFAHRQGAITIGLIGFGGGKLKALVDIDITVSSRNYGQVEDFHLAINHILTQYLREVAWTQRGSEGGSTNNTDHVRFLFSKRKPDGVQAAVFLDRDGILNHRIVNGYVTEWSQFRFRDGIINAMVSLAQLRLPIIVVSNQACVGKNLISLSTLQDITERFVSVLEQAGARIDAVYYCPHVSEQQCRCRKPESGLLEAAARDWRLDLQRSVLIGDSEADVGAAHRSKCSAVYLSSGGEDLPSPAVYEYFKSNVPIVSDALELPRTVRRLLRLDADKSEACAAQARPFESGRVSKMKKGCIRLTDPAFKE